VRRLSVANLDSGAESPVYGKEPSALADRGPVVNPPRADGDGRRAVGGGRTLAGRNFAPGVVVGGRGRAVCVGGITSPQVPQCGATRKITMNVTFVTLRHVGPGWRDLRQVVTCRSSTNKAEDGMQRTSVHLRCRWEPNDLVHIVVGRASRSAVPSQAR